jgi:hypothetical protein
MARGRDATIFDWLQNRLSDASDKVLNKTDNDDSNDGDEKQPEKVKGAVTRYGKYI